jgi:hypothetical protein
MSFNSTYRAGDGYRPAWDAASAAEQVRGRTSRGVAIRFAHTRALDRASDRTTQHRSARSDDVVIV